MKLNFKAEGQKNPLEVTTKLDKEDVLHFEGKDIDASLIKRKVVMAPQTLDEHGQLFFEIVDGPMCRAHLGILWNHLLDPEFIVKIEYPGGAKLDKPRKDVVTVYRLQGGIAIDVDAMQYYFPNELDGKPHLADPFIKDITDPKELIVRLIEDLLNRPDEKRPKK
jgi:hypothetical protein